MVSIMKCCQIHHSELQNVLRHSLQRGGGKRAGFFSKFVEIINQSHQPVLKHDHATEQCNMHGNLEDALHPEPYIATK